MNKRMSALLAALALVCALTACGGRRQSETDSQNDTVTETPENGSPGTGTEHLPDREDPVTEVPDDDPGLADGGGEGPGVPLEQMLKNARTHDRDGDLTDGENAAFR